MGEGDTNNWLPEDTIRVLIASDIHLGFMENDAIRGEDSFIAFEEVLSLAVQYDVDIVLLGGDLFHQAKPSPSCMFKCSEIIRKYCFGDKPVSIELLSDQIQNFARNINYEDPNLNVSYPILSIHGNHDDPVGQGSVSSLDILSITGLVNYFGKWCDYTHVRISPVLMQKGATRLALYGLSHLKDQRLSRLFKEKKVEMERPDETLDWFNLLTLHQNRADRGPGNYIPEDVLPKFMDLVVWGHEHDSEVYPMRGSKQEQEGFFVVQPGSTVATSLAAGEARPKHAALLQIHKGDFMLTPLLLKTVRPFIFKTIVLSEENLQDGVNETEKVQELLKAKVEEAITEANERMSGDPKQPKLPLVRLSVFYYNENQNFNHVRFGQNFNGVVANPTDILIMKKERKIRERKETVPEEEADITGVAAQAADVESLIQSYFEVQPQDKKLNILSVRLVTEAVRDFTIKHNDEVLRRAFDAHKRRCITSLMESNAETEEEITEQLKVLKNELNSADDDKLRTLVDLNARPSAPPLQLIVPVKKLPTQQIGKKTVVILSSDEEVSEVVTPRGRGRGAARGGRRGRSKGFNDPEPKASPTPPERRTPRRTAARKSADWLQSIVNNKRNHANGSDIESSD